MPLPPFGRAHQFDPRSIPGLAGWWDAADAASVTLDSGRVSQWADKSGLGRHAANSTSGSTQPDYITAGRNGLNVVRFTAASVQALTIPSSTGMFNFFHDGTVSWSIAVAKFGTTSSPNALYGLFGNNGTTSNRSVWSAWDSRSLTSSTNAISHRIGNGTANISTSLSGTTTLAAFNNLATANTYLVNESIWSAAASTVSQRFRVRINGGSEAAGNVQTGTAATGDAAYSMQFGAVGNNSFPLQGDICEIMFFSEVPTAAARDLIRRYLGAKWGITVA